MEAAAKPAAVAARLGGGASSIPAFAAAGNLAVQRRLRGVRDGEGAPLGDDARARLPPSFGDVSDLRVHTGAEAAAASAALNTSAFTVGRHLFFSPAAFNPGGGILAHEVAHGIQQRDAGAETTPDPAERIRAEGDAERAVDTGRAPQLRASGRQVLAFPDPLAAGRAQLLFNEYMAGGEEWYERGNHAEAFSLKLLGLIAAGDVALVTQVLQRMADDTRVAPAERRGISLHIVDGLSAETLDTLASGDTGSAFLTTLADPLQWGWGRRGGLIKIEEARARASGHKAAEKVLLQAQQRVEDAPALQALQPLDPADIGGGLSRARLMLSVLHKRYDDDIEIGPAIATAEADLEARFATKPGEEIDFDDDARQLGATVTILTRFIDALSKFDRMLPPPGAAAPADPMSLHFLQLTGGVRKDWIAALDRSVMPEGPKLLAVAEAKSAALPEALLQLYLSTVPAHGAHFEQMADSVAEMLGWVRWTQAKLKALHDDAEEPPGAAGAADVEAREKQRRRDTQLIELSVEGIKLWDLAIRAHEQMSLGISLAGHFMPHVLPAYADAGRIRQRCGAMKTAAVAEDLETLSALAQHNRDDPNIQQFFQALPLFINSANLLPSVIGTLLINFTILKFASMAGSAAGALISSGEGASLLNISAQVGLEALVFTGTSRVMQSAIGQPSKSSFLIDLALNVGLFGVLRFTGAAVRGALTSRGLDVYAKEATHVASFAVLQTYGTVHFAIEKGRWPTAKEFGDLSIDGLIMYAALVGTHRRAPVKQQAHSGLAVLEMLHTKFGTRLASVETAKSKLAARLYEQLRVAREDPVVEKDLAAQAAALEASLKSLLEEIKADPKFEPEPLRKALADPALQTKEISDKLLAELFGAPGEAGLTAAGESQYSYAPGATEVVVEVLEAKNAVVSERVEPSGLHTLIAEAPGQAPMFLSERPAVEPAKPRRRIVTVAPAPAPQPARPRAPHRARGEIFGPEGLTDQGVTQVRQQQGDRNLSKDAANLLGVSNPKVHEHLVKEHYRRAINRGEIPGRVVSGNEMNMRRFLEEIPQRNADGPPLDEPTRDFIDRQENAALRSELVSRLTRLRGALGMTEVQLPDAAIANDPWEAAGRLREKAQATLREGHSLRRAAEDYVAMFARSIGDLKPDMMVVDAASPTVVDATHTVGTQFEVFHEFKTMLYVRIVELVTGLPVIGVEFRSPREQRTL